MLIVINLSSSNYLSINRQASSNQGTIGICQGNPGLPGRDGNITFTVRLAIIGVDIRIVICIITIIIVGTYREGSSFSITLRKTFKKPIQLVLCDLSKLTYVYFCFMRFSCIIIS